MSSELERIANKAAEDGLVAPEFYADAIVPYLRRAYNLGVGEAERVCDDSYTPMNGECLATASYVTDRIRTRIAHLRLPDDGEGGEG